MFVFVQARCGCLSVIGAKACAGARVALWEEHGRVNQRWSLNEDGSICSHLNRSLVLDLKGKSLRVSSVSQWKSEVCVCFLTERLAFVSGGHESDRNQLILSPLCADNAAQTWDIDVL